MISSTKRVGHGRDITGLLLDWRRGDPEAFDELLPLVYQELRSLARARLARERRGQREKGSGLLVIMGSRPLLPW